MCCRILLSSPASLEPFAEDPLHGRHGGRGCGSGRCDALDRSGHRGRPVLPDGGAAVELGAARGPKLDDVAPLEHR